MRHDNISISLPPGYLHVLNEESARYGLNRSEFVRVLLDAYLTASLQQIEAGKRPAGTHARTGLETLFPHIFPHKREEAEEWLHNYLRLVIRIFNERAELKKKRGSVDEDAIHLY